METVPCSEAGHVLCKALGMDPAESLSAILADNARLIARQELLERVSANPIMNDLFTVINLQAARLLKDHPSTPSQQAPGVASDLGSPYKQHVAPQQMDDQDMRDAAISGQNACLQHILGGDHHAGSCDPLSSSEPASAKVSTWCNQTTLLPQVSISRQQGTYSTAFHSTRPAPHVQLRDSTAFQSARQPSYAQQEGHRKLSAIPENDSQACSMHDPVRDTARDEQREDIRTPSQNSAEGAVVGLDTDTPHPAGLPHSSTATSAAKRSRTGHPCGLYSRQLPANPLRRDRHLVSR